MKIYYVFKIKARILTKASFLHSTWTRWKFENFVRFRNVYREDGFFHQRCWSSSCFERVCLTVRDWEMLTEAVEIPENIMPLAFARLTELTVQELEVSWNILLDLFFILFFF